MAGLPIYAFLSCALRHTETQEQEPAQSILFPQYKMEKKIQPDSF